MSPQQKRTLTTLGAALKYYADVYDNDAIRHIGELLMNWPKPPED